MGPEEGVKAPARKRAPTDAVATYPSAVLRATPSFTIAVPAGWVVDEAPGALGVIRVPEEVDGFWVNLIISADRVDHRLKLAHAASVTLERLMAECPDAEVMADRIAQLDGQLISTRVINLTAPGTGREITQIQGLTAAPRAEGAKTRDMFHLTGTTPRSVVERFGPVLVEMISSFRLV